MQICSYNHNHLFTRIMNDLYLLKLTCVIEIANALLVTCIMPVSCEVQVVMRYIYMYSYYVTGFGVHVVHTLICHFCYYRFCCGYDIVIIYINSRCGMADHLNNIIAHIHSIIKNYTQL